MNPDADNTAYSPDYDEHFARMAKADYDEHFVQTAKLAADAERDEPSAETKARLEELEASVASEKRRQSEPEPFTFHREHDGSLSVRSAIFQALGRASTCWENMSGTGVFDSTHAKEVGDALILELGLDSEETSSKCDGPHLGLATTRRLLDEIYARIEIDYHRGGGGLDYATVTGRPKGTTS